LHGFLGPLGLKWQFCGQNRERVVRYGPQKLVFYSAALNVGGLAARKVSVRPSNVCIMTKRKRNLSRF